MQLVMATVGLVFKLYNAMYNTAGSKAHDLMAQHDIPGKSLGGVAHPEGVPEASASERRLA